MQVQDPELSFKITSLVIGQEPVPTISARELHRFLQVGRDFTNWIKERISQYGFAQGQDFEVFAGTGENPLGGRPAKEYAISLDMAKELAMVERTIVGQRVRRYFIDCEKKLRQQGLVDAAVRQLVLPSPLPWEKRFHDGYYEAIAQMANLPYSGHASGTPPLFGKITDEWVYQVVMPPEVLAEMRARRAVGQKLHQWLTAGGQRKVEQQILLITNLARSSANYQDFRARCMRTFDKPGQLGLIYPLAA